MFVKLKSSNETIAQIVLIKVIKLPVACWKLVGNHKSCSSLRGFQGVSALGTQHRRQAPLAVVQGEGLGGAGLLGKLQQQPAPGQQLSPL